MAKLAKNFYRTAKGEKKLNCFSVNIPKEVVSKAGFHEDDEIRIYADGYQIIIEQKYYYECNECGCNWPSGEAYNCTSSCPRCSCGDLSELNYDN